MASFNPYMQYQKVQFGTADQGTLILMSYDGAIRFCQAAKDCMTKADDAGRGLWLTKAFDVVGELRKPLRMEIGGEVAENLNEAYAFISRQITLANVMNKIRHLENALMVLENLREAWSEIIPKERRRSSAIS